MKRFAALAAVVVLCFAFLCSCAQETPEEAIKKSLAEQLDVVKAHDEAFISDLLQQEPEAVEVLESYKVDATTFLNSLFDGFDYSVDDVLVEDGNATATVTLKCKTLAAAAQAAQSQVQQLAKSTETLDEDELGAKVGEILMEAIDQASAQDLDPVTFTYVRNDDVWELQEDCSSVLLNAMMGTSGGDDQTALSDGGQDGPESDAEENTAEAESSEE